MRATRAMVGGEWGYKHSWKRKERGRASARKDRRKQGVKKPSTRSIGVGTIRERNDFVRDGSGSHPLQDLWTRPIPDAHGKLQEMRARLASAFGVPDSSPGTAGGRGR